VRGGDVAGLLKLLAQLREKGKGGRGSLSVDRHPGGGVSTGFWIDRVLQNEGIEKPRC